VAGRFAAHFTLAAIFLVTIVLPSPVNVEARVLPGCELLLGLDPGEVGDVLAATEIDVIVVTPDGEPDGRLPAGTVQLACTPTEYRLVFPDQPAEVQYSGVGRPETALAGALAENSEVQEAYLASLEDYIYTFEPRKLPLNVCIIQDCSYAESPCFGDDCSSGTRPSSLLIS